ncbi:cysteine-rich protein 2-binding protein isoform X1 [Sitophilus oryzae]|uniref:Cysteine-rich protein 2-binding protein isoform X1 n=1 Tax=Sitophilus oryzae TaxID=7048 RepID=A0A6J2XGC1_SITOR|nr:cysteine-rich protein 2-binding protein isoform X1 [Sitophilus oryzae]XP_030750323.1 cysteine-rich protein 2-binding protein isoform X1 [Sitophilus oryzae]
MEGLLLIKECKYCHENLKSCLDEGIECIVCNSNVHAGCLKRGSVPGGLHGDLFYNFTCQECSDIGSEKFVRQKLSWLQVITLSLYHLGTKSAGLARNGFFHWRDHIVAFIDRNWDILFPNEIKRKKKWIGTVAGRLSHYSSYLFLSGGKTVINKTAWWTLMYPKITPLVLSNIYNVMNLEKQKAKSRNEKRVTSDAESFDALLKQYVPDENLTKKFDISRRHINSIENIDEVDNQTEKKKQKSIKRKILLPNYKDLPKKLMKFTPISSLTEEPVFYDNPSEQIPIQKSQNGPSMKPLKLLDPMCYYNTSLNNISRMKMQKMHVKLTGNIRKEITLSPYSGIYLKPYIRRDVDTFPSWLKLMAEIQLTANKTDPEFILNPRAPIDYTYVQPEHIPAINSLCNQFFWPGIDLTESLQYPDFSCVALYKRLIIGFAFLVPDVKHTENYISFVFTRPGWRNCSIAKFMVYHLIQTSLGRDITLHVSINNPALFLYQQFGFKVENVVLDFYDKYFRTDVQDSKHAFFCRLER